MADKTGIDNLVPELERICLEHYAMKSLLHEENPRSWRNDVRGFYRGNVRNKDIRARFDGLYAELLSSPADTIPLEILIAALKLTNLDDQSSWMKPPESDLSWR